MPSPDNILYYLTIGYQLLAMLSAFAIGVLFFFKRSGGVAANRIYGLLLLTCGGIQLHYIFAGTHFAANNPSWPYLPIYFTLSLPVLFFYYIKYTLFPAYQAKPTDLKHGILPIGQMLYIWAIFFIPEWRIPGGRHFYNPFYGGTEQALFIALFPIYIFFGYEYFRHLRRQQKGKLSRRLWYIHKLLKGSMFFFLAYAILALSDFFLYKFFHLDLREYVLFAALAAGSFSSLVLFFVVYGFQVLLWGRKLLREQRSSELAKR